jgi:hypothetical protein
MTRPKRNPCACPYCTEPKDTERGGAFCMVHEQRWLQSKACAAAATDEVVVMRFALGLRTLGCGVC